MDMFVNVKNVKESLQLQVHLPYSAIFWTKLYVGDMQSWQCAGIEFNGN